jgi:hypothetical protein
VDSYSLMLTSETCASFMEFGAIRMASLPRERLPWLLASSAFPTKGCQATMAMTPRMFFTLASHLVLQLLARAVPTGKRRIQPTLRLASKLWATSWFPPCRFPLVTNDVTLRYQAIFMHTRAKCMSKALAVPLFSL